MDWPGCNNGNVQLQVHRKALHRGSAPGVQLSMSHEAPMKRLSRAASRVSHRHDLPANTISVIDTDPLVARAYFALVLYGCFRVRSKF